MDIKTAVKYRRNRLRLNEALLGYLFYLPFGVVYLAFLVYPVFRGLSLSFYKWNIFETPIFIGWGNYRALACDSKFWLSLKNTLYFTGVSSTFLVVIGCAMAVALNVKFRGQQFFRALFFSTYVLSISVVATIWLWLYQPQFGLINYYLTRIFHIAPPSWLANTHLAMNSIIIVTIWWTVGFNIILFLAGLQEIPQELYEAASIDGAGGWQNFWYITLPSLRYIILLVTVLQLIASFQIFGQVYIMTGGGPYGSTRVLVQYIYENAFKYFKMGYAAAMAFVLFLIMAFFSSLQFRMFAPTKLSKKGK